jgi:DNA-binding response OmpR family regulator
MALTVAVINSNDDTVDMLRFAFEKAGFNTVTAHIADIKRGKTDFLELIQQHDPALILYDVAHPYKENWVFLQMLRTTDAVKGRQFLLTTTNKALLQKAAGPEIDVFELSEKPYDIQRLVDSAKRMLGVEANI